MKLAARCLASLVIALSACSDSITGAPESFDVIDASRLPDDIRLTVFETTGSSEVDSAGTWAQGDAVDPRILLVLKTSVGSGCGTRLDVDYDVTGRTITADVKRVVRYAAVCSAIGGGSTTFIRELDPTPGEYHLRVYVAGVAHEFDLVISPAYIELTRTNAVLPTVVLASPGVRHELTTFWRFPRQSLAWYCSGGNCGPLGDRMSRELGLIPYRFGSGGVLPFPVIGKDAGIDLTRYFLLADPGDFARIRPFLCSVAPGRSGTLAIALSWANQQVHNFDC